MSDTVIPSGCQVVLPISLLLNHKQEMPVGKVTKAEICDEGIRIRAQTPKIDEDGDVKRLCDRAWHLIKAKLVDLSVGFRPIEASPKNDGSGGMVYKKWQFIELSLTPCPANPYARIEAIE
jgi:uncharacterized protein